MGPHREREMAIYIYIFRDVRKRVIYVQVSWEQVNMFGVLGKHGAWISGQTISGSGRKCLFSFRGLRPGFNNIPVICLLSTRNFQSHFKCMTSLQSLD